MPDARGREVPPREASPFSARRAAGPPIEADPIEANPIEANPIEANKEGTGRSESGNTRVMDSLTHPARAAPLDGGEAVRSAALSGALAGLAIASANIALQGPLLLTAASAAAGLIGAGLAMWPRERGAAQEAPTDAAMAITTLAGTLTASNAAFEALTQRMGLSCHPDAFAVDEAAATLLFAMRRRAVQEGEAAGFLPPSTFARVIRQDDALVHLFEPAKSGPAESDAGALARAMVAAVPAPIAIVAADGAILAANPQFIGLVGEGERLDLLLIADPLSLKRFIRRARDGASADFDAELKTIEERRVRLTANAFQAAHGAIIVGATDITSEAALEARLLKSQKLQVIGVLAGKIAHDFNNVLNIMTGFAELLLQRHRPSDPAFNDIMQIRDNGLRGGRLANQLLAFARRQTLLPAVIDINDAIADLMTIVGRLVGERVTLDVKYGRDLWPVLADLGQVEQVVINLAANARDAMPEGGTLTIRTANVPHGAADGDDEPLEGDAVLIEVGDVGTGMPSHVLEKIYEPFFTTKALGKGTGLGLSTVYGIVKQSGGTLSVDSREGIGTTFRIYLPRAASEVVAQWKQRAEQDAAEAAKSATETDLTGNATVLVVEDEDGMRAVTARTLSKKGYRVLEARSGAEALEVYARADGAVDLLLTDVMMPELDGPSLVKRLRGERPDLKVIFMSGYADGASLGELGNVQFLEKPFLLKPMVEAVKRELGRKTA